LLDWSAAALQLIGARRNMSFQLQNRSAAALWCIL
jgi:hypothetical protein